MHVPAGSAGEGGGGVRVQGIIGAGAAVTEEGHHTWHTRDARDSGLQRALGVLCAGAAEGHLFISL